MTAFLLAVCTASLLGSLHCAGMCGPFVAFAVGTGPLRARGIFFTQAAYHGGRLATYLVMGIVGGALGAFVNQGGAWIGVQRAAAMAAGGLMIAAGSIALARCAGTRLPELPVSRGLTQALQHGHRLAACLRPVPRALLIGGLTTLLPCGWLYAFAITAAGTGSPWAGALTMAAFWVGTVPVLAGVGIGAERLSAALRPRLALVTSLALVLLGVITLSGRLSLKWDASLLPAAKAAGATDIEHLHDLTDAPPPCCRHEPPP